MQVSFFDEPLDEKGNDGEKGVKDFLSVSELNNIIKTVLSGVLEKNIAVFGEVSGIKVSGGHAYFTLKDKDGQLSCVCFSCSKTYLPKDGESIVARGSVDYWTKGGRLSFSVNKIEPVGKGLLFLEFERLKAKLQEEGLFDERFKKPIPAYPKNALILTSVSGAVIRDIVTTIRRKNPVLDIVVKDVRVQGQQAAADITAALKAVDGLGYDVIVIARGGGSLEDLAPFYDEGLVRAVFAAKTPIVSAVGHETDFSLCDFAADKRAPTPTAAAELIAYDYYAVTDYIFKNLSRSAGVLSARYENALSKLNIVGGRLSGKLKQNFSEKSGRLKMLDMRAASALAKNADLQGKANRVRLLNMRAVTAAQNRLKTKEHELERHSVALDKLNPVKVLETGYFRVLDGKGKSVLSVTSFKKGDKITAVGSDGRLNATVDEIIKEKI